MTTEEVLNKLETFVKSVPEYPGEMPDFLYDMISSEGKEGVAKALRASIVLMKKDVLKEIETLRKT